MAKLFGVFCASGLTKEHDFIIEKFVKEAHGKGQGEFNSSHFKQIYLAQVDYQGFGPSAFSQSDSQVAMLIGHPLLSCDRIADLKLLNQNYSDDVLSECDGVFCFAKYNQVSNCLDIATDALGIRPFYYMYYAGAFIFSTQFSLLKSLGIELTSDQQGMMEYATLGYYLLDHTHYQEISCIPAGYRLQVSSTGTCRYKYFDWQNLAQEGEYYQGALEGLKNDLEHNVAKYLADDRHVVTTLSGGLDSRLVTCLLKHKKVDISALNFSQFQTQDLSCAKAFAESQNVDLDVIQVTDTQSKTIEDRLGEHWRRDVHPRYSNVSRPRLAWSGNGGSVGLGVIYYSERVYNAALTQDVEHLVDAYLNQQLAYIPKSIIRDAEHMQKALRANLIQSLEQFKGLPLEKAYYLFLLLNDQHHHLATPFDKVDEYQMDFCLPFYSWKVLRHVLSQPVSRVRKHRFYHDFLHYAYPHALKVPWQAYPEHIPCHLLREGIDQWHIERPKQYSAGKVYGLFANLFFSPHRQLVNMSAFSFVVLIHSLGLKVYNDKLKIIESLLKW